MIVLVLPIINYIINDCHETPNQYINAGIPQNKIHSLKERSTGALLKKALDLPNIKFIHDLKKKDGANK
jgi:hypothetical protein